MPWFGPNMTDDKVKQIMDFQFRELTEDKQYISHDSCDIWICGFVSVFVWKVTLAKRTQQLLKKKNQTTGRRKSGKTTAVFKGLAQPPVIYLPSKMLQILCVYFKASIVVGLK